MNKILYFNGCSWPEGSELNDLYTEGEGYLKECKDRCSTLLSSKLGFFD